MDTPKIRVKTEGFRAIGSAHIIIDGITVVAGENGCGKSTLSKLLYYLYKTATNFDDLVEKAFDNEFNELNKGLKALVTGIKGDNGLQLRKSLRTFSKEPPLSPEKKELWTIFITQLEKEYSGRNNKQSEIFPGNERLNRLRHVLSDILEGQNILSNGDSELWKKLMKRGESIIDSYLDNLTTLPSKLLINDFRMFWGNRHLPKSFELYEFGDCIVSMDKPNLGIPFFIEEAIYIDTPVIVGLPPDFDNTYWEDLYFLLEKKSNNPPHELSNLIRKEIIGGEVFYNDDDFEENFSYLRNDGATFELKEVATGIKAFGIIQMLLNNGSITDKTLLIIDEPESNLHPQWIIEYARLIVLLHKHIGVKFFIATHNPDMVSALKYISAKEGIGNDLNFYLAEKAEGKNHQYNYKLLRQDIDPIFASFNIALDRINQYGA